MRQAKVFSNGTLAGILTETDNGQYVYQYDAAYLSNHKLRAISLTLPKREEAYISNSLFPFFFNMLSEGANKKLQCKTLKIDEDDAFGLLLATASHDTIGSITIKGI